MRKVPTPFRYVRHSNLLWVLVIGRCFRANNLDFTPIKGFFTKARNVASRERPSVLLSVKRATLLLIKPTISFLSLKDIVIHQTLTLRWYSIRDAFESFGPLGKLHISCVAVIASRRAFDTEDG
jgi:hypothetical protein